MYNLYTVLKRTLIYARARIHMRLFGCMWKCRLIFACDENSLQQKQPGQLFVKLCQQSFCVESISFPRALTFILSRAWISKNFIEIQMLLRTIFESDRHATKVFLFLTCRMSYQKQTLKPDLLKRFQQIRNEEVTATQAGMLLQFGSR